MEQTFGGSLKLEKDDKSVEDELAEENIAEGTDTGDQVRKARVQP
jgi:hypothetical protein